MTDIKKTVTFTADVSVEDADGEVTFEAKAGDTKDLVTPSANRWIRRGKAVEGKPEKPKAASKPKSAKPKAAPKKQAD